ncbi:hypothetical protein LU640_29655 [Pseudomonas monteilii]|uniref:hypothetical protein n=1 Tax=Pseudomonas TaxID=286 RepID=UPI00048B1BBC|nr:MULTISPECIES: hypothetical protein [Pseudomonas]MBA1316012.1 hypothetical protein [Pseudomonas monteilii]MBA6092035.1 hypothetical protein [Pseudomonas monteilii]MCE1020323.1 hypothetical protein [Pseudomonas monteilii]MCE1037802.1 hypothetical protein [Pseudomonas monteilii]MCE1090777.1 hypothetical protein [Pseudomonas monteilii]
MKLQQHIKSTLGWCLSIGIKLLRVVPFTTITVQVTTLASQIFLLLAFFLPLKVIILLGSEKIPNYFPSAFQALKKNHLIVSLSVAAAACYVLYLLSELLIAYCCRQGARTLLLRSAKLNIIENQEKIAAYAYSKFTRAMAAALFFAISAVVLLIIYPKLLAIVLGYTILATLLCVTAYNFSPHIQVQFQKNHGNILNALSATGFLLSFFCLVADFLYFPHQRIFHAVIAVLVMRQALQRLTSMVQDIISLRMQHRQINAMFFQSQPLLEQRQNNHQLECMLSPSSREAWIEKLMDQAGIDTHNGLQISWHQIDAVDVYAFHITVLNDDEPQEYLAKLFGNNITTLAVQERLLFEHQSRLPSIEWLGHYVLQGIDCHLFRLDGHKKLIRRQIGDGVVAINEALLCCEPASELISRFSRSRPYLEQRLERAMIEPLRFVCSTPEDAGKVERLLDSFELIIKRLSALPRQIVSLDITSEALLISDSKQYQLSHWSNWRIEAVGSNWPVIEKERLFKAIEIARNNRPTLLNTATHDILLSAFMYSFERFLLRKDYPAALRLLDEILAATEAQKLPDLRQESTQ